jgi:DivIVA domain-containing protein
VQQDSIERIRSATFTIARKGYDKREVERFLQKLADWLEAGGGDQARSDLVKRELERVGEKTSGILSQAEDSAESLRAEAEQEASATLNRSREQSTATRKAADEYASKTRGEADQYSKQARGAAEKDVQEARARATQEAREMIAEAQSKAQRIVEDGVQRRRDIESVISDLVRRRDSVLGDVDRLAGELQASVRGHTPAPGEDAFATPDELDPAERKGAAAPRRSASGEDTPTPAPARPAAGEGGKRAEQRPAQRSRRRRSGGEQVKAS